MEGIIVYKKALSFAKLEIKVMQLGKDYNIQIEGGEVPHIGCTVLAVPRPSLKNDGTVSVTASVINVTGHKDEVICRYLAEEVSRRKAAVVVCTGGFHMDGLRETQISEIVAAVKEMAREI